MSEGKNPAGARKNATEATKSPAVPKCAVCGRPREVAFRPFCSRRCADVDLSRWMNGAYSIAGEDEDIPGGGGHDR